MMSKSLNYAYPQKFAEGGDVAPDTRQRLEFTPSASGGMVRYVLYDDKGREAQSGVTQRKNVESGLFGPGTNEKYNVSFLEQAPAPDTPVFSPPPGVDPTGPAETPTGYQSSEAPSDALTTLQMAVGLQEEDLRYDANQDGRLGADDALLFRKYAELDDYDDSSGFMAGFYGQGNGAPPENTPFLEPTQEEMGDMFDSLGGVEATTFAVGEEDGGGSMPPLSPDMATTAAIGEEDTPFLEPDMDDIFGPRPGVDPVPDTPVVSLPPGVDPTVPAPFTPSPVVNPVFTPSPVNTAFTPPPPPPVEGRTYGAYSGTPMGPTNSIQPFTPYMPPQQAQGPDLQSLITDTNYFLNNSGPHTSVFKRS